MSRKKIISKVFAQGKSVSAGPFKAKYRVTDLPDDTPCSLMIAVPKRNFKLAVKRNRIKRLVREVFRCNKHELYAVLREENKQLAVTVVFLGKEEPDFQLASEKINLILQRLKESIKHN